VAFDSSPLRDAQLNYPTHEKELLAILRALRKWKSDLLGSPFLVYTDHKTLLNFHTQKDLSRRQARWMEELAIYDCKFVYVKGENNTVADALSRYPTTIVVSSPAEAEDTAIHPFETTEYKKHSILSHRNPSDSPLATIAALVDTPIQVASPSHSSISIDKKLLENIRDSYKTDPWCIKLTSVATSVPGLQSRNNLWFIGERLVVPAGKGIREQIFRLAHDTQGHFGFFKTYEHIRNSFFWPGMRRDLEYGYIPSCTECIRNKGRTSKSGGPLHPLPVPDERCDSISMDFVGPLPVDNGYDCILTITDRLNSDV
jgi:hypothetical protein